MILSPSARTREKGEQVWAVINAPVSSQHWVKIVVLRLAKLPNSVQFSLSPHLSTKYLLVVVGVKATAGLHLIATIDLGPLQKPANQQSHRKQLSRTQEENLHTGPEMEGCYSRPNLLEGVRILRQLLT